MEPGHEDREYGAALRAGFHDGSASMEPGHEDREYTWQKNYAIAYGAPQWSPVMKTGNTWAR